MIYVDKILHNRESSDVLLPGISTKKSSGKIAMMVCDGIVQVITTSSSSFYLSRFKHKLKNYIVIPFICICSLNLSSYSSVIIYTVAHSSRTDLLNVSKYCSVSSVNSVIRKIFFMLELFQSVFSVGIMLLISMQIGPPVLS